jgi:hypothetical protein
MTSPSGSIFALASKSFQMLSGMIFIVLLPHYLSLEQQGLFYSLSALVGVISISENGLTQSLLVAIGQKQLHLAQEPESSTQSNELSVCSVNEALDIFTLAILSALKKIVVISAPLTFIAFLLVRSSDLNSITLSSWFFMLIGSSLVVVMNLFQATEEAIFGPRAANKSRMYTSIVQSLLLPIFLVACKSSLFYGFYLIAGSSYYLKLHGVRVLRFLSRFTCKSSTLRLAGFSSYRGLKSDYKEFYSFNRDTGIAFIVGYFIAQSFTPAIYYLVSPSSAGKWGLTYQVIMTISYACFTVVSTQAVNLAKSANSDSFTEIVNLVRARLLGSILLSLMLASSLFALVYLSDLAIFNDLAQRFLPIRLVVILILTLPLSQCIYFYAMVFRSHNVDPTRNFNIFMLIFIGLALPLFSSSLGILGPVVCYCILVIISFVAFRQAALTVIQPS